MLQEDAKEIIDMLLTIENWHEYQDQYPNFAASEMASRDSGLVRVSLRFMQELQLLRTEFTVPMHINSGCRTSAHNKAVGGHPRSLHICDVTRSGYEGCLAVDIRTIDPIKRGDLFSFAWENGWSIGWGKGFLHLDRRLWVGLNQRTFDY